MANVDRGPTSGQQSGRWAMPGLTNSNKLTAGKTGNGGGNVQGASKKAVTPTGKKELATQLASRY